MSATAPRTFGLNVLPLLALAAIYSLFGIGFTGGLMPTLAKVAKISWPGTTFPVLRDITGISVIDGWLSRLNPLFAHVTDGSDIPLTVYFVFGFGQFGTAFALVLMEALREGNQWKLISFASVFGIAMQTFGVGVITPIYLFIHLLTSPLAKLSPKDSGTALLINDADLTVLPISLTLGYIVPSLLMTLPSPDYVSNSTHQKLIAVWQGFPIWVTLIQTILSSTYDFLMTITTPPEPAVATTKTKTSKPTEAQIRTTRSSSYLTTIKITYTFLLTLCMLTHLHALIFTLLPLLPSSILSPIADSLTPTLSTTLLSPFLNFSSVYLPPLPSSNWRMTSIASGIHFFLHYDIYIAAISLLLWASVLLFTASGAVGPRGSAMAMRPTIEGTLVKIGFWTVVAGPVGAVVMLAWERDRLVLGREGKNTD